jgi:hypothetical protein
MKKLIAIAIVAFLSITSFAEEGKQKGKKSGCDKCKAKHEAMKNMSPEEREAHIAEKKAEMKAKMEERIASLPAEEQDAARTKMAEHIAEREAHHAERKANHEKMASMSEEERAAFKKELKATHGDKKKGCHCDKKGKGKKGPKGSKGEKSE